MYRYWWCILLSASLAICLSVGLLVASASFHFRHPRYPQVRFEVTGNGQVILNPTIGLKPLVGEGTPRIVVDNAVHEFGYMAPATRGEHIFSISNQGTGNLFMTVKSSTCRCTVAELPSGVLPPGKSAEVRLQWHTPSTPQTEPFCERVTLGTNDPLTPELALTIRGHVRQPVWAEPGEIVLPQLLPKEQRTIVVPLHSDIWPTFQVTSFTWSQIVPGLRCRVVEGNEPLTGNGVKARCLLEIEATADVPAGYFCTSLLLKARGPQPDQHFQWEIPVSGTRLGRYSIFGPALDSNGDCIIGKVARGQAARKTLTLRIRDGQIKDIGDLAVESSSPNLKATLQSVSRPSDAFPLFLLHLDVPQDAAECNHMGVDPAVVTIRSNLESRKTPVLRLPVRFAVVAK